MNEINLTSLYHAFNSLTNLDLLASFNSQDIDISAEVLEVKDARERYERMAEQLFKGIQGAQLVITNNIHSASVFKCECSRTPHFYCVDNSKPQAPVDWQNWIGTVNRKRITSWKVWALKPRLVQLVNMENINMVDYRSERQKNDELDLDQQIKKLANIIRSGEKVVMSTGSGIINSSSQMRPLDNVGDDPRSSSSWLVIQFMLLRHIIQYAVTQNHTDATLSSKLSLLAGQTDNHVDNEMLNYLVKSTKECFNYQKAHGMPSIISGSQTKYTYAYYCGFNESVTVTELEELFTADKMLAPAEPFQTAMLSNELCRFTHSPVNISSEVRVGVLEHMSTQMMNGKRIYISQSWSDINEIQSIPSEWHLTHDQSKQINILDKPSSFSQSEFQKYEPQSLAQTVLSVFIGSKGTGCYSHIDSVPAISEMIKGGKKLWCTWSYTEQQEKLKKVPGDTVSVSELLKLRSFKWFIQTVGMSVYFTSDIMHMIFNYDDNVMLNVSIMPVHHFGIHLHRSLSPDFRKWLSLSDSAILYAIQVACANLPDLAKDFSSVLQRQQNLPLLQQKLKELKIRDFIKEWNKLFARKGLTYNSNNNYNFIRKGNINKDVVSNKRNNNIINMKSPNCRFSAQVVGLDSAQYAPHHLERLKRIISAIVKVDEKNLNVERFENLKVPLQHNPYDCGLFVIRNISVLMKTLLVQSPQIYNRIRMNKFDLFAFAESIQNWTEQNHIDTLRLNIMNHIEANLLPEHWRTDKNYNPDGIHNKSELYSAPKAFPIDILLSDTEKFKSFSKLHTNNNSSNPIIIDIGSDSGNPIDTDSEMKDTDAENGSNCLNKTTISNNCNTNRTSTTFAAPSKVVVQNRFGQIYYDTMHRISNSIQFADDAIEYFLNAVKSALPVQQCLELEELVFIPTDYSIAMQSHHPQSIAHSNESDNTESDEEYKLNNYKQNIAEIYGSKANSKRLWIMPFSEGSHHWVYLIYFPLLVNELENPRPEVQPIISTSINDNKAHTNNSLSNMVSLAELHSNKLLHEETMNMFTSATVCIIIGNTLSYEFPYDLSTSSESLIVINKMKTNADSHTKTRMKIEADCDKALLMLIKELGYSEEFRQFQLAVCNC